MTKTKKTVFLLTASLIGMIVILAVLWGCFGANAQSYECVNQIMSVSVRQTVYGRDRETAAQAAAKEIGDLESRISWRESDSDLAKLNQEAGSDWVQLDPKTISLLATVLDVAQKSEGAFDPTILPIASLWDFGGENQHVPSSDEIQKYLPYVNYRNLRIDQKESSASLRDHYMAAGLDEVEEGAVCDAAVEAYRVSGCSGGIAAAGDSVGIYGTKPDHSPWRIAVRGAGGANNGTSTVGELTLENGFLSTVSADTHSFTQNGAVYHSVLNPATGRPAESGLQSVTVVGKSGVLSSALAHACFVLGENKGEELMKTYGAEGILVDRNNRVSVTSGLKDRFTIASGGSVRISE